MNRARSLAGRALIAIALLVGFYVLALGIAAVLLYIPYADWRYLGRVHPRIALPCIAGAAIILISIRPRLDQFIPPGPELKPEIHRRLFDALQEIARTTKQAMPAHVYLTADVNAWVSQRGGVMGFGSRRIMGLGLPLMSILTVSQFRAVLAHEFGHYHAGDTALGPWIHKTRIAIGRTLETLQRHRSRLSVLFMWYGDTFLRVTQSISRQQEFAADALAGHVVGTVPLIDGLRAVHRFGGVDQSYWGMEVQPVLDKGFRPPLVEGFRRFVSVASIVSAATAHLEHEMQRDDTDPLDSHPPLRARLETLQRLPASGAGTDSRLAIDLFDRVDEVEQALIEHALETTGTLTPIAWSDVPSQVLVPAWRAAVKDQQTLLAGVSVQGIPDVVATLADRLRREESALEAAIQQQAAAFDRDPDDDERATTLGLGQPDVGQSWERGRRTRDALHAVGAALTLRLIDVGFAVRFEPGELYLLRDGVRREPFAEIGQLLTDNASADWRERYAELGLADTPLAGSNG